MPIIVTFALFILYTRYNLKSALRFYSNIQRCSPVLGGLLRVYVVHVRFQSSAPAVSQPSTAGRATTLPQQVRSQ